LITFVILCEQKTLIDANTGIARHDLLAALIMNEFNWSNIFGMQVHCTADAGSVVDTNYAARTLTLTMATPNNLVKTQNRSSYVVNSLGG
jgi:hypothetical protein